MTSDALEQAITFIEDRDYAAAEPLLLKLHEADPSNARVNYALGLVAMAANEFAMALGFLEMAARVATQQPFVFTALSETLLKVGDTANAVETARRAVSMAPSSASAQQALGEAYLADGRPVMARAALTEALKQAPDNAAILTRLSQAERALGEKEAADLRLKAALETGPNEPETLLEAVGQGLFTDTGSARAALEKAMESAALPGETRFRLSMAAGHLAEREEDPEAAFAHYGKYRALAYPPYEKKRRSWQIDAYRQTFTREYFMERFSVATQNARPVFILGLPSSGAALLEDLLTRHRKLTAGGEVPYFDLVGRQLRVDPHITPTYFQGALRLPEKEFKRIGRGYQKVLDGIDQKAAHIVHRMVTDYEHLWLLALLFPRATFIHIRRDPLDTCAGLYRTVLPAHHNYNASEESLVHHVRTYRDLMAFWQEVLPIEMTTVNYEDLIADPDGETRRIWAAMGIEGGPDPKMDDPVSIVARHRAELEPASGQAAEWGRKHFQPFADGLKTAAGPAKVLH
ncbi:hypothetical protein GCM10011316_04090 [Roseibium aquae]|uniref:Tetratricopeptide repeat protein n=1 Tax=Roseibium aquae TaxID=1323746 RepID=A0A916WWE5_9HYPH|nr:sulfotransferase [Roseibium aquae]GGB35143.1 hypothetical protein GCM10011316_04090 [Roseibium aquae]